MIELMLVVTIGAILAAMVTPRVNRAAYDADAAAGVLRGTLQTAQRVAVAQQIDVIVSFDLANQRLRVLEDMNANGVRDLLPTPERLTYRPLDVPARFATPPSTVSGSTAPTTPLVAVPTTYEGGLPGIRFHRDGSASDNGEAYLRVTRGGVTEWRAAVVSRPTGRVSWWARTVTATSSGSWARRGL